MPVALHRVRSFAIWELIPFLIYVAAGIGLYVLIALDRQLPIKEGSLVGLASPPVVQQFGTLNVRWEVERIRSCPTTISREFIGKDNQVHRLDQDLGPYSEKIGFDAWTMTIPIPVSIALGAARYRSTVRYHCGWTHEFLPLIVRSPEIPFEVVRAPQQQQRGAQE